VNWYSRICVANVLREIKSEISPYQAEVDTEYSRYQKENGLKEKIKNIFKQVTKVTALGYIAAQIFSNVYTNYLETNQLLDSANEWSEYIDEVRGQREIEIKGSNGADSNSEVDNDSERIQEARRNRLYNSLKKHEGFKTKVYPDPIHGWDVPTIGVGYNLTKPGAKADLSSLGLNYNDVVSGKVELNEKQIMYLLKKDVVQAEADAKQFLPNFAEHNWIVQQVIINMAFNMGLSKLSEFERLRAALINKDYASAVREMIESEWYGQVGNRSKDLVREMRFQVRD